MNRASARVLCTLLIVLLSGGVEALRAQQEPEVQNPVKPPIELPDSPGKSSAQQPAQANPPAQQQNSQATTPANPSGTAVAPAAPASGGAASKPAGVAIAPPKQRQIRSLLIKLGFLAGAGAALGTVAALSAGSPAHVPNSPGH
jgi:hypothetical protein